MKLAIEIKNGKEPLPADGMPAFAPGDTIAGMVSWDADEVVSELELRLLFQCKGKGTPQREVFDRTTLEMATLAGRRISGEAPFSFTAADWPWSFSGKLISLVWMIQAESKSPDGVSELPIIISPSRSEIDLYAYPLDPAAARKGILGFG